MNEERLERLMVQVVDAVATAAEREELMAHVVDRPDLAEVLAKHRALKAVTDGWVKRLDADLAQDEAAAAPSQRLAQLGVAALVSGVAVLTGGGVVELFLEPTAPAWLRLGVALSAGGTVVLLGWAAYFRMKTGKRDPYNEVIR